MKRFSSRATRHLVKKLVGGASVGIKRDRQRLSGAKRRDRYNRLGSARHCCVENWMQECIQHHFQGKMTVLFTS